MLLWLPCEAALNSEEQSINRLSTIGISITHKETENFPAVIEEGDYPLKTNRLNVLSPCGKSYHGGQKWNTSLMVFYCNRCITKPSHYAELHSYFVGKTAISSLENRKSRYLTGSLLSMYFYMCSSCVSIFWQHDVDQNI